jgi:hypothetical protein
MSFSRWLRSNSEHYLLIAAQARIARRHGARTPRSPRGLRELFWLRVFAPVYRTLPWSMRHKIMLTMPGSHRRQWAPPPLAHGSAVPSHFPSTSTQQQKESGNGTDRG